MTADPVPSPPQEDGACEFERRAAEAQPGLVREFLAFLAHSKKWWLAPIILVLLLFGLLILLGSGPVAPFIYTLF